MNKLEFTEALRAKIAGLPEKDIDERIAFYCEMIDDRIEDGLSEEEAIEDIGSVEDIAAQIISEIPLSKIVKNHLEPKRKMAAWEIALIIVSFPIWLPLIAAIFAIVISIYAALWSVVVSIWAVFASFVGSGVGGILAGTVVAITASIPSGLFLIFAGILLAGLSILLFFGSLGTTRGMTWLTKRIALWIKKLFIRKEGAQ
jgi:uncharacterized membrane protein